MIRTRDTIHNVESNHRRGELQFPMAQKALALGCVLGTGSALDHSIEIKIKRNT